MAKPPTNDDNFQGRASEEGRQAQELAEKVLHGCGFKDISRNQRFDDLGLTVNFIAQDTNGRDWYFDVSGAFTSQRPGLQRTDTMWKTLGRASVLHQSGIERLILLTTNLPVPESGGHLAMTAASATFFDAVEMLTVPGKARLTLYAKGEVDHPVPGLRRPESMYHGVVRDELHSALRLSVPLPEVAALLPERAITSVVVMPHRVKVFLPSKNAEGEEIAASRRTDAGQKIRELLATFAGGCTLSPGVGTWLDPVGGEMFENVTLIEAYAQSPFPETIIADVMRVLFDDLGQHTAALIINDTMVNLSVR